MKKIIIAIAAVVGLLLLGVFGTLLYCAGKSANKAPDYTELKTSITLAVNELSEMEVYEYAYLKPLTLTYHRSFLSNFDVTAIISGKILYSVALDSVQFNEGTDTLQTKIFGRLRHRAYVDHNDSHFVNPEWRFGYNEFQIADTLYKRAQADIDSTAVELLDPGKASDRLVAVLDDLVKRPNVQYTVLLLSSDNKYYLYNPEEL
jgi:hypothetical protein